MEWLNFLTGKIVGLDTAPLIYFIEKNPRYITIVREFFSLVNRGEFEVITSTLTLTEVLVYPLRMGNLKLAKQYQDILLNQEFLTIASVSNEIANLAAELRATKNLRTPDAIQLATAIHRGADFFLTNDRGFKSSSNLTILILDDINAT